MKAVITGSTGLTGKKLLINLLHHPSFSEVISVSRTPVQLAHPKLREVMVDFEKLSSYSDALKGDHYFCCLGTTIKKAKTKENFLKVDFDYPLSFAHIAKNHNAKSFSLISASGASVDSKFFYNQVKGKLEKEIKEIGLSKLIIYHPGLLLGLREEKRTVEDMMIKLSHFLSKFISEKKLSSWVTDTNHLSEVMGKFSVMSKREVEVLSPQDIFKMALSFQEHE